MVNWLLCCCCSVLGAVLLCPGAGVQCDLAAAASAFLGSSDPHFQPPGRTTVVCHHTQLILSFMQGTGFYHVPRVVLNPGLKYSWFLASQVGYRHGASNTLLARLLLTRRVTLGSMGRERQSNLYKPDDALSHLIYTCKGIRSWISFSIT